MIFYGLMAKAFGKVLPKCGTRCKRCSLKHAENFQQKCWWWRTASFAPFTLCWRLCELHKWRSKHNARWLHVSQLKASAIYYSYWKMYNVNKMHLLKPGKVLASSERWFREYLRGKYHCNIDLRFDWFGISCMTTDNFCFYLQNRLIQTSQTGGQWYSDTSPFSIPWVVHW